MPERPDLAALRRRYTPEPVPPCGVCGAELTRVAPDSLDAWACSRRTLEPTMPRQRMHYGMPVVVVRPGDPEVLALADYAEGLEAKFGEALSILADLRDDSDCRHDYRGYCHAHNWLCSGVCICPQRRLREFRATEKETNND